MTDQPFRPCQEETVIDCRFAVGDILDVVASLGGCDLDVLVSGAVSRTETTGPRMVDGQLSPVLARIYRRADENSL